MDAKSILLILQYAAVAILFAELIFVLLQKSTEIQKWLIILAAASILLFVGYNIEISAKCVEQAVTGAAVSYMGKPFVMLYSYMFLISFYHMNRPPKWLFVLMNVICTAYSCLVFSNHRHYLYYSSVEFDITQKYSPLILGHGILYYSYVVIAIVYFAACLYLIFVGSRRLTDKMNLKLNGYVFLMIFAGLAGYLVFLAGITNGYDSTIIGVFIGVLCIAMIFFRCRLFDTAVVAKDMALEDSPTGLIVFDIAGAVSYKNHTADMFLDDILTIDFINKLESDNYNYVYGDRALNIIRKPVESNGMPIGKAIEITDITDLHKHQQTLQKEVNERTEKIANIQRDVIASVANIVEARNVETGEHIKRTSTFAAMIAKTLLDKKLYTTIIDDNYIDLIYSAAPLHDIGKIAVPDYILLKPGKLTDDEFEIMKTHVDKGVEIIQRSMVGLESKDYTDMALDIAAYHHERWDGKGYTHSLAGEDIPLSARIVAVADCFDAMISDRCYKKGIDMDAAMKEIKSESGSHFDPMVVYAFEEAMRKYKIEGTPDYLPK